MNVPLLAASLALVVFGVAGVAVSLFHAVGGDKPRAK